MKLFKTSERDQIAKEILTTHACGCGDTCGPDCKCGPDCPCKASTETTTKEAQGAGIPVPADGKPNDPVSEEVHMPQPTIWQKLVEKGRRGISGRREQVKNTADWMRGTGKHDPGDESLRDTQGRPKNPEDQERTPVSAGFNMKRHKTAQTDEDTAKKKS